MMMGGSWQLALADMHACQAGSLKPGCQAIACNVCAVATQQGVTGLGIKGSQDSAA